jgi:hypothetical protein
MYGNIKYTSISNTQALGRGTIAIVPYKKVERYARPGEGQTENYAKSCVKCRKTKNQKALMNNE